ncbi:hypothetical protein, partial [Methanosarcina mazei]|uniref:hypothetical protein n=1 Tax=Methanosarcina mazei TaxID=2209 RepID=UPI00064EB2B5
MGENSNKKKKRKGCGCFTLIAFIILIVIALIVGPFMLIGLFIGMEQEVLEIHIPYRYLEDAYWYASKSYDLKHGVSFLDYLSYAVALSEDIEKYDSSILRDGYRRVADGGNLIESDNESLLNDIRDIKEIYSRALGGLVGSYEEEIEVIDVEYEEDENGNVKKREV